MAVRPVSGDLVSCSVLSGNRNFEGRIGPDLKANFLASPPLVVAYALAGSLHHDFDVDPLGVDAKGNDVSKSQAARLITGRLSPLMFATHLILTA